MKKLIKLSIIPLMMGGTAVHATNGTNLFGFTTVNQGMGGAGLAYPMGSNSALINPALIKGNEVSFGVTYFKPSVATDVNGAGDVDSAMDKSVIPNLTFAFDLDDKTTIGVAMYGSAGVGVDYRDSGIPAAHDMLTNLQVMRFSLPIAYQATENLRLGFAPVAQYGSLDMSFDGMGNGVSQDYGFGYEVGGTYRIPGNNIKIGAAYKSAISMSYTDQISAASKAFMLNGGLGYGDALNQPSEMGVGVTYIKQIGDVKHVFSADYKRIAWSSADGYSDFGWEDQSVYTLGYEYNKDKWALRAGLNYSKSPVVEQTGATTGEIMPGYDAAAKNFFNLVGFPATVQSHFSTGFSYNLTETIRLDGAYAITPTKTLKFDTAAMGMPAGVETTHAQQTVGFGFNVKF